MTATKAELYIRREFNAPRAMVWQAWTDPRHLPYWWGPKGMPTRVVNFDFRVGGSFLYHMRRPDGSDMWGKFTYKDIKAPEKLVWVNSFTDDKGNVIRAPFGGPWDKWPLEIEYTLTLAEKDGRTIQELRGAPVNADEAGWAIFREMHENVSAGFNATMDQLEFFLRGGSTVKNSDTFALKLISDREAEMTRMFDAPKNLVFLAHSKAEHIKRWWGLRDHTTEVTEMEFRKGGKWRFVQRSPDGAEYAFRGEYLEIIPNESITWTFEFEGMPGAVCVETVRFEDVDGRTRLVARSRFDSAEAAKGMVDSGMEWGARQTWDRLEELAANL
jgi:uncharacterized protein YndB with AHSA1/START domain